MVGKRRIFDFFPKKPVMVQQVPSSNGYIFAHKILAVDVEVTSDWIMTVVRAEGKRELDYVPDGDFQID